MLTTLIALPYKIARLPFTVIDKGLTDRLPETSKPRVALARAIGGADKLAGSLTGDRELAQNGADRIERSGRLLAATRLEQDAAARREQAAQVAEAGERRAAQQRKAAQKQAASGLDEADAAEARGKKEAKAKATRAAAAKKAAATKRAADRTATVEQRTARVVTSADAKKLADQRGPKADLEDAHRTEQAAAKARADADRLSALTEAKKQERTRS